MTAIDAAINEFGLDDPEVIEATITAGEYKFPGDLLIQADVRACHITARGTIVIQGLIAGATVQASKAIFLTRAGRSILRSEGDIHVKTTLRHCDTVACGRVAAADGAAISGGCVTAGMAIEAFDAGAADCTPTSLVIGSNRLYAFRMDELEAEIQGCKENIHKIAQAIRAANAMTNGVPEHKRRLIEALEQQRRAIEERVESLMAQKRSVVIAGQSCPHAYVQVRHTAYPGIQIAIRGATIQLDHEENRVHFESNEDGTRINQSGLN